MSDETSGPTAEGLIDELESGRLSRAEFTRRALAAGLSLSAIGTLLGRAGAAGAGVRAAATGSTASGKVTLQFWKFVDTNGDPVIKKAVQQWNAMHPNVQVNFQTFPFGDYMGTKLTTAFAAGKGPDVFWISPAAFLNYVTDGIAAPLDDIIKSARRDYLPAAINAATVNGHIYALPFEMEPVALYYNKASLAAAGLAPPQTWPDLLAACEKLKSPKQYAIVVEPSQGGYQNFTWYPFLWSAGADVVAPNWKHSALRTPKAASAFELWGELINKGYAPSKTATLTNDIGPLGRGETAMQVCGFWAIAFLKHQYPQTDFGIVRIPKPAGGKYVTVYGGWKQMVSAKSHHVAEAKAFTKWLWMQNKGLPHDWACVTNTKFSPRKSVNKGCAPLFNAAPDSYFTKQVLPTARAEPRYPDQIVKAVGDGIQAAMFGGKSGADAAKMAADEIDQFLKTYHGAH